MLKIGDVYTQTTPIKAYAFDYVGESFRVKDVHDKVVILVCDNNLGLCCGIDIDEFPKYFKPINNPSFNSLIIDMSEYQSIFIKDNTTTVVLRDGTEGVAKCMPEDEFDVQKGIDIATAKAKLTSIRKQLQDLLRYRTIYKTLPPLNQDFLLSEVKRIRDGLDVLKS